MKPRFEITITLHRWACGDGCCSDSGYICDCFDRKERSTIYDQDEWQSTRRWGHLRDEALYRISQVLGRPAEDTDYVLFFRDEEDYEEYNSWDSTLAEHKWAE